MKHGGACVSAVDAHADLLFDSIITLPATLPSAIMLQEIDCRLRLSHDAIDECLALLELSQGLQHTSSDVRQGMVSEVGYVRRDNDVGEGKQPAESVILQHVGRTVGVEEAGLVLIDVERSPANSAALEAFNQDILYRSEGRGRC